MRTSCRPSDASHACRRHTERPNESAINHPGACELGGKGLTQICGSQGSAPVPRYYHALKPRWISSMDSKPTAELMARSSGPVHLTGHASWKVHDCRTWCSVSLTEIVIARRTIMPCMTPT